MRTCELRQLCRGQFGPLLTILFLASSLEPSATYAEMGWHAAGKGGAIAAGDERAVSAGMRMLKSDGNAADAAAATLLALSVTDYGRFAIGGTVPLIVFDANSAAVKVLSGAGRAPLDPAAIAWFYENDIPKHGSMKSAPVPGAVDLCVTLLRKYGTKSFTAVCSPTLEILDRHAEPWHANLARTLRKLVAAEASAAGDRQVKLTAARDCFYRGEVADELDAWYVDVGAFLRKKDLENHKTLVEDSVSVTYRGYTIHKCGPWTQGPVLCQTLRLLEGFNLAAMKHLSSEYIHTVVEALKLGFADRDLYYGDPLFSDVPMRQLLSDPYTVMRRPLIDAQRASLEIRPGDPLGMKPLKSGNEESRSGPPLPVQDTTTCVVADRWGNVISATPSCNLAGNTPGPAGVTQGNRVRSLNTTPGHPNRVAAGKRPRITLTPTLITKNGKPVGAISVAGGDLQDQTTLNVLLNFVEFGMTPSEAVTAARFSTGHHENSFDSNPDRRATIAARGSLQLQNNIDTNVRQQLESRGHKMSQTTGPIAHPVMLTIDPETKMIYAAGDPRAERHADAIP